MDEDVMTTTGRTRMNLGIHHLLAAGRMAAQVSAVERDHRDQQFGEFWDEILQFGLGVVTLSASSIESYANELYFEGSAISPPLNDKAGSELADLVDREPILRKFSMALAIRSGKDLDFGIAPVQNADALIKLRNAVVHFRPEWFSSQEKHDKLSRVLQHKFQGSPFLAGESLFPRAWASADFCGWALRSTVVFLEHFHSEAGLQCSVTQFKSRLAQLSGVAL
jgi:hypothetical protein